MLEGTSKMGYESKPTYREQVGKAKERLLEIYGVQDQPPDCFVA